MVAKGGLGDETYLPDGILALMARLFLVTPLVLIGTLTCHCALSSPAKDHMHSLQQCLPFER